MSGGRTFDWQSLQAQLWGGVVCNLCLWLELRLSGVCFLLRLVFPKIFVLGEGLGTGEALWEAGETKASP